MKSIPVVPGNKYTILTVSAPATLGRVEVLIVSILEAPEFRPSPNGQNVVLYCIGTGTLAHDRACRDLDIDILGALVIPGWDQFTSSSAVPRPLSPEPIRQILDANLNPHFERYESLATCQNLPESAVSSAKSGNASKQAHSLKPKNKLQASPGVFVFATASPPV